MSIIPQVRKKKKIMKHLKTAAMTKSALKHA